MNEVVIVDDDPTMGHLLKTLLGMEGYQVIVHNKGSEDELLSAIQQSDARILLMDVHIQKTDGISLLKKLRASEEQRRMHIIMTSGMDLSQSCLEAGADAFLMKPYMPDELFQLIRQARTD